MSLFSFGREKRLLTAAGYQSVFKDTLFKVSQQHLLLLARKNDSPKPRLGVVVAKKHIKLAVSRNRIKRVTRNTFRLDQQNLSGLDIVFLARAGLDKLPPAKQTLVISKAFNKLSRKSESHQLSAHAISDEK